MPGLFQIFSQSDYLIQNVQVSSDNEWQTVQIQISCLLQKPTDLDLHCFKGRVYPGSAEQGLINGNNLNIYLIPPPPTPSTPRYLELWLWTIRWNMEYTLWEMRETGAFSETSDGHAFLVPRCQGGRVVSTPNFRSWGAAFESRWNSANHCMALYSTQPSIITLPLFRYDLNNVEMDIKQKHPNHPLSHIKEEASCEQDSL